MSSPKREIWTKELVVAAQQTTKKELDRIGAERGPSGRLKYILDVLGSAEESQTKSNQDLRRYILVVSALVHHERQGGLKPHQIKSLLSIGYALLRKQQIVPGKSLLSYLYGDLHLAVSQIYRKDGEHLRSAWEQQLAYHLTTGGHGGGNGIPSLSLGIRLFRLGLGPMANKFLLKAEEDGLPPDSLARCRLERTKLLRLSGNLGEARTTAQSSLDLPGMEEDFFLEMKWELLCCEVSETGDPTPLFQAIQRKRGHHSAPYLCEAFLWTRCSATPQWLKRFPKVTTIGWGLAAQLKSSGPLYQAVRFFERAEVKSAAWEHRLKWVGNLMLRRKNFPTLEKDLLLLLALARWLSRKNAFQLSAFLLTQYRTLSLSLSGERCADALQMGADLFSRSWFDRTQISPASKRKLHAAG